MEEKNRRLDEAALRRLLEREQTGPEALVLRLAWLEGLTREEIASLTWEQVQGDRLRLPGREVPLAGGARRALEELAKREGREGPVLTAPRSGLPYDRTRLSKLARAALVRAGLDDLTLRDLRPRKSR